MKKQAFLAASSIQRISLHRSLRCIGLAIVVALAGISVAPQLGHAATLYWDTNDTTAGSGTAAGTWGTNTYWYTDGTGAGSGGGIAATSNTDDLHFSAAASGNIYNATANLGTVTVLTTRSANSITFDDSWPVTLSGGTSITLGGGGGTNPGIYATAGDKNAAVKTISTPLILGAAGSIQNSARGELRLTGGITGAFNLALNADSPVKNNTSNSDGNAIPNNGGIMITTGSVNNGGTVTNSGTGNASAMITAVVGTNVTKVIQNSATSPLVLSGANLYTSGTNINAGILMLGNATALGPSGAITFGGGTLNYGTQTTDYSARLAATGGNAYSIDTNNRAVTFATGLAASGSSGLNKFGPGTLTLSGANLYTGTTTIGGATGTGQRLNGGTLAINALAGSLNSSSALTFGASGTFNYDNTTSPASRSQTLNTLTFSAGDGTVQTTRTAAQNVDLKFSSLATRSSGATGNFVVVGAVTNGADNKIWFTAGPAPGQLIDRGLFFGTLATSVGSSYAAYDSGGFVRALAYGTDANTSATAGGVTLPVTGAAENVQLTGALTAQATASINTLNINSASTVNVALDGFQTLSLNGILRSGSGASTISGGTGITTTASGNDLVIRTNLSTDILTIASPLLANGTNGLTKAGAGTLKLSGAYNLTGDIAINAGTLVLDVPAAGMTINGSLTGAGGLTKTGAGTLTIGGTTSKTFNGPQGTSGFVVNNGTLVLDLSGMTTPTNLINPTTPIALGQGNALNGPQGGANLLIKGKTTGSTTQQFTNISSNAGAHRILVDPNGGTDTTVVLGNLGDSIQGPNSVTNGSAYLIGKAAGAGSGNVIFLNDKASNNGPQNADFWGGRLLWTSDGGTNVDYMYALQNTVGPYDMFPIGTRGKTYTTLTPSSNAGGTDFRLTAADIGGGGPGTLTMTTSGGGHVLKIENPAAGQSLNLGGNTWNPAYGLLMTGSEDFTILNGSLSAGANSGPGRVTSIAQYSTGTLTISARIGNAQTGNSGENFVKFGPGRLILAPTSALPNNFNRSVFISEGILQVGSDEATTTPLGTATGRTVSGTAGAIVFSGGTLQYSAANQFDYASRFATTNGQQIKIDTNGQAVTLGTTTPLDSVGGSLTLYDTAATPGTLTLPNTNTYTDKTTVTAGTLHVTGSLANNNIDKVFIAKDADNNFATAFTPKLSRNIQPGAPSFTNFGSTEVGGLASAATVRKADDVLVLKTLAMEWRGRNDAVVAGETTALTGLASDVIRVTGVDTVKFVLQMSYNDADNNGFSDDTGANENDFVLGWLDGSIWENAILGNHGAYTAIQYNERWDSANALHYNLGAYGIDTLNNVVWAVIDHNSSFAVIALESDEEVPTVPEPGTFALAALALVGLGFVAWQRRRRG